MKDVEILLEDRPGALADMAQALGRRGIGIEGGGTWSIDGQVVAHFLFADDAPVTDTLAMHGIKVVRERPVVLLRLEQGTPGQLGLLAGRMAAAGVQLQTQYSDHNNQLVLVPADANLEAARAVAATWMSELG